MLQNLKAHKAPGPDSISPRVLRELADIIAPMLTMVYKKSYDNGEVPTEWWEANVTPIYKKDNKSEASSNRPVELASSVGAYSTVTLIEYPCGRCSHKVTWVDAVIFFNGYEQRLHVNFINMSLGCYHSLAGYIATWMCGDCGLMNTSTLLFNSQSSVSLGNTYQLLSSISYENDIDSSILHVASSGILMHALSPRTRHTQQGKLHPGNSLF